MSGGGTVTAGDVVEVGVHVALVGGGGFGLSDELDGHVYLLRTAPGRGVLVDTGVGRDAGPILANLAAAGIGADGADGVDAILLTHAHADHAGGAAALAGATGASVLSSAPELELLRTGDTTALGLDAAKRNGTYPPNYAYRTYAAGTPVRDGDRLAFGELSVTALVVPGHTAGSVVWLAGWPTGYTAAFSGDTVFTGGLVSVLNLDGSDAAAYRRSLPRLAEHEADGLFPGHGEFRVHGGTAQLRLAAERMTSSVIPNRAVPMWRPAPRDEE